MRLIDADAIISQCKEYSNLLKYDGTTDREWAVVKRIILIIKEQPTIEPHCEACEAFNKTRLLIPQPERKKGKWIEHNPHKWGLGIVFECSECGEKIDCEPSNFCPNCGAEMTEESEEPKRCDTCKHEKEPWSMQCHRCDNYNLWEGKR